MCHYDQLTFPVPAVIVDTLNPPEGPAVVPVKPPPIEIVLVSGYLRITMPDPPAADTPRLSVPPPPPLPVFAAPVITE
jgi:hypothetical protein